ncbi:unnamed protein product [Callosobruchus maculatus]|uniref:Uncharacterized protein n=1 Tax=Callosobruchus maculatus TaxID=64391 RepID=A0A653DDK5_CALMS|nr:unnamed protein product [Callosobruchus maculatus]
MAYSRYSWEKEQARLQKLMEDCLAEDDEASRHQRMNYGNVDMLDSIYFINIILNKIN